MTFEKIAKKGIKDMTYFARGRRGLIYKGKYKNKEVVVKIKKSDSAAQGRMANEAKWLKLINKKNIGPKLLLADKEFICYEYADGEFLPKYIQTADKKQISSVLNKILGQTFALDSLKINKEEMHRPLKHILIDKQGQVTMIDFERCYKTDKPKNTTQFCQFILSRQKELNAKGITISREELINAAKEYKNKQSNQNFNKIITLIK